VTRVIRLLLVMIVLQGPVRPTELNVPGTDFKIKAGWRLFVQNGCRYSVPLAWQATGRGTVSAPDGSTLSVHAIHSEDWPTYRAELRRSAITAVVHEDSASRLWIEFVDEGLHEHHIAVPVLGAICSAVLELRDSTGRPQDLLRGIAEGIGPAPAKWPPSEE
jgi:hypothetical protein